MRLVPCSQKAASLFGEPPACCLIAVVCHGPFASPVGLHPNPTETGRVPFYACGCRCSLDLLANLAQLYPEAVLQTAFSRWQELAARWIGGFSEAGIGGGGPVRGGGELGSRLAWVTRDACSVLQLWAALFEELFR